MKIKICLIYRNCSSKLTSKSLQKSYSSVIKDDIRQRTLTFLWLFNQTIISCAFFLATGLVQMRCLWIEKKKWNKVSELEKTDWFDNQVLNSKSHILIVQKWQLSWTYVAIRGKIWWCSNTNLLKSFQFCKTDMTWKGPYNHELKWCKKFLKSVPLL